MPGAEGDEAMAVPCFGNCEWLHGQQFGNIQGRHALSTLIILWGNCSNLSLFRPLT